MTKRLTVTWHRMRPGLHIHDETGIEVRRVYDEDDAVQWQIWSGPAFRSDSRCIGVRPTIHAAKARAAELADGRK